MSEDNREIDENDLEDFQNYEEYFGFEDNEDELDFDIIPIKSDRSEIENYNEDI